MTTRFYVAVKPSKIECAWFAHEAIAAMRWNPQQWRVTDCTEMDDVAFDAFMKRAETTLKEAH